MEDAVWKYLEKIRKMGGSVRAIERGFFQSEIRQNAYRLNKEADGQQRILVGVNRYEDADEEQPEILRIGSSVEMQQREELKKLRASRDRTKWEKAVSALSSVAETDANLMPHLIKAVEAEATTGEISDAFRSVFGRYEPKEVF